MNNKVKSILPLFFIISIQVLAQVSSTDRAKLIRFFDENIKLNLQNENYDQIVGNWEGKLSTTLYLEKKNVKSPPSQDAYVRFYFEDDIIHGLFLFGDIVKAYRFKKESNLVTYKLMPEGESNIYGMIVIEGENRLKVFIDTSKNENGMVWNLIFDYQLKKNFPLKSDLLIINEQKEKKEKERINSLPRTGSGFAISSNGLLVTNFHVIENAKSIRVRGINGDFTKFYKVEVISQDQINDLAILKINDSKFSNLNTIPFKIKSTSSDVGEDIFVLGYPLTSTMGYEVKLTTGVISSKTGFQGSISQYQISAPIQPGNSGGPLFDKNGNLVGVINSKHLETENVSYAIKTSFLQNLLDTLPQKISTPSSLTLREKSLSEQVKILRNFVYLIEVNNE